MYSVSTKQIKIKIKIKSKNDVERKKGSAECVQCKYRVCIQ